MRNWFHKIIDRISHKIHLFYFLERRRRWSDTYKGVPSSDDEDEVDAKNNESECEDPKLKREEQELEKIATGIGKVFLQNVREREKIRQWKAAHLDPRNASRFVSINFKILNNFKISCKFLEHLQLIRNHAIDYVTNHQLVQALRVI